MTRSLDSICEAIDDLISVQIEVRPGGSDRVLREISNTVRQMQGGLTMPGAELIAKGVNEHRSAIVTSGWVIDQWFPRGEVCGIIGAIGLVRFLVKALKKPVLFPSEEEVLPVAAALCRTAGVRVCSWEEFISADLPQVCLLPFPKTQAEALVKTREIIDKIDPGAMITIEKCAPAPGGVYHTGNGSDMSSTTSRLDVLVGLLREAGVGTVGVGDLGNEIGFGGFRDETMRFLGEAGKCTCGCGQGIVGSTETDVLVVGSTSNRCAMGLEAALGAVTGHDSEVRDGQLESELIAAAISAGAVDSFTVSPTRTDGHGVPAEISGGIATALKYIAGSSRVEFPLFDARS